MSPNSTNSTNLCMQIRRFKSLKLFGYPLKGKNVRRCEYRMWAINSHPFVSIT